MGTLDIHLPNFWIMLTVACGSVDETEEEDAAYTIQNHDSMTAAYASQSYDPRAHILVQQCLIMTTRLTETDFIDSNMFSLRYVITLSTLMFVS